MIQEEQVQTLMNLGLSFVQAKTYLNLAKLREADIKTLAAASNVARQDTYRIMSMLENMGLAEKIIGKTTMYKAASIKEGLAILLQRKKKEYVEAQKQVKKTFNNVNGFSDQNIWQKNVQFTITSEVSHLIKMHEKMTKITKKSIDFAIPVRGNEEIALQKFYYLKGAMRRGVKVRIVTEGSDGETIVGNPKSLSKNSLFELRYLPERSIQFGMHIFDDREVTLAVSEIKPCPSVWTNSAHVVKLARAYFESIWNNAQIKSVSTDLPVSKQPNSSTESSSYDRVCEKSSLKRMPIQVNEVLLNKKTKDR